MLRALLESIAYSMMKLVEVFMSETGNRLELVVVDGGVSRNNFIVQMIADLTGKMTGMVIIVFCLLCRSVSHQARECGGVSLGSCWAGWTGCWGVGGQGQPGQVEGGGRGHLHQGEGLGHGQVEGVQEVG